MNYNKKLVNLFKLSQAIQLHSSGCHGKHVNTWVIGVELKWVTVKVQG